MSDILICPAELRHADDIAGIYNHYVLETIVTFEEELVSPLATRERMVEVKAMSLPWFVAMQAGQVIGYSHASKWKGRCAYRYSAETTVYVDRQHTGRGIGVQLYTALLKALRELKYHAAIGGIALPNEASVKLHEKMGFHKVGQFEQVGFKHGQWIDVGYWQIIL